MTEEEIKKAICKLAGFKPIFADPKQWIDYSLEILVNAQIVINTSNNAEIETLKGYVNVEVYPTDTIAPSACDHFGYSNIQEFQTALYKAISYVITEGK